MLESNRNVHKNEASTSTEPYLSDISENSEESLTLDDKTEDIAHNILGATESETKVGEPLQQRVKLSSSSSSDEVKESSSDEVKESSNSLLVEIRKKRFNSSKTMDIHNHYITKVQTVESEAIKLKKVVAALVAEYDKCTSEEEKTDFKNNRKSEIEQMKAKLDKYKLKLDRIANRSNREEDSVSAKDIDTRYKTITSLPVDKNASEDHIFFYKAYGSISNAYKSCLNASTELDKLLDKRLFDLNFEDSTQCNEFVPFVKGIQDESKRIETQARDTRIKNEGSLKRQISFPNDKGLAKIVEKETEEIDQAADSLSEAIDNSLSKLKQISKHIKGKKGDPITFKEMIVMLEEKNKGKRVLKNSQSAILKGTQETLKNLSAGKEVLQHLRDKKYQKLTEKTIRYELILRKTVEDLANHNETNKSILQSPELLELTIKRIKANNKLLEQATQVQTKISEKLSGVKSKTNPLENIKTNPLYAKINDDSLQVQLKRALKDALEKKMRALSVDIEKNKAEIDELDNRIKDLNI